MKEFIQFRFSKNAICKFDLSVQECVLLHWMYIFQKYGKPNRIVLDEGEYFWVGLSKAQSDLGQCLGLKSERTFRRMIDSLCKKTVLYKKTTNHGFSNRIFLRINQDALNELLGVGEKGEESMNKDPFGISEATAPKVSLNKGVVQILDSVNEIMIKGDTKLFSFKDFRKTGTVTKSLQRFNKILLDIYTGRFSEMSYPINEEFKKRNNITDELLEKLRSCKGKWQKLTNLIIKSANHYALWFDSQYAPLTKDWLPRDITMWFYNPMSKTSLFLASLLEEPEKYKEVISQKALDSLPSDVYQIAFEIRKELFPSSIDVDKYWLAVNRVYKIEKRLKRIHGSNHGIATWLNMEQDGDWTIRYLEWLRFCWGEKTKSMIREYHVGVNGKTWAAWIKAAPDLESYYDTLMDDSTYD